MNIDELLSASESEWLDRKRQFDANRVSLIHDLLCLANSFHDGDRFLLFGQSNDRRIVGVEADNNRINNAQLHDLLRQSRLNRLPTVNLRYETVGAHEIGVLCIKNRPDKPFFVTADKECKGRRIRAGVIYTRLGETNVPMDESASDEMIELMWRERFGLGLAPLARFHLLLNEPGEWVIVPGHAEIHHLAFPEFTIRDSDVVVRPFMEPWALKFPDQSAYSFYKEVRYLTTVLDQMLFVSCDGGRYSIPAPTIRGDGTFVIDGQSMAMRLARQLVQYSPLVDTLARVGIEVT
jgi:hypothetical protein